MGIYAWDNEIISEFNGSIWWEEWALDCAFWGIISLNLGEGFNCCSNFSQEGEFRISIRGDVLDIIREFRQVEVSDSQIPKGMLFITDELIQIAELGGDLFNDSWKFVLPVRVEGQWGQHTSKITIDSKDGFNSCLILKCFTQKLSLTWLLDDVEVDCPSFTKLEITINKVRKIGEDNTQFLFILIKPSLFGLICHCLPVKSTVGKEETTILTSASYKPVSKCYFVVHIFNYDIARNKSCL